MSRGRRRTEILGLRSEILEVGLATELRERALREIERTPPPALRLEVRPYPGPFEVVQTLIVGDSVAGQTYGAGDNEAVWGTWDGERQVILTDATCAAYSLRGEVAFGDEEAWVSDGPGGKRIEFLVQKADVAFIKKALRALDGWLENRLVDSRANEALCREEGTYLEEMPAVLPELVDGTLRIPAEKEVLGSILDVLGTTTAATHPGWDRRGARELRVRIEEALSASQLGPEILALCETSAKAFGRGKRAAAIGR
jgi:hypothetical protein